MKYFLIAPVLFFVFEATGQKSFRFGDSITINMGGETLPMPFAGGINAAQVQQLDVNGDGVQELVVYDRNAGNLLVFEKSDAGYLHNPVLAYYFPDDISGFLILADFDGDGEKDLFTGSPFGIKVYKNVRASGGSEPLWEVAQDFLRLESQSNLQVNSLDIPAILDIDGDGDLDIVTFNFASGDFLEFYQNTSMERKGVRDIDGFAPAVSRWGGFEFCGCDQFSFGRTCSGTPLSASLPATENLKTAHAGGHSILLHDFNGDGHLDILMGQDECGTLYFLPNAGSNASPIYKAFSRDLPQLGPLPEFPIFHGAYLVDQDLLVTANSSGPSSQHLSDYSQSMYHYEGITQFTTAAYLQEDMVDLGENTRPFFMGNASSGELIVTANGLQENRIAGRAYRFLLDVDGFRLTDDDYLNLSSLSLLDLQYQEYIRADNRAFLFLSGVEITNFTPIRKLLWAADPDGQHLQEVPVPEVPLRGNDHLEFFQDQGEDYMLLARQTGELIRFRVIFDPSPRLELLDRNYLGFTDNPATRNLTTHVIPGPDGQKDLYAVDQRGILSHLPNFMQATGPAEVLLQWAENERTHTRLGRNTWIASIPAAFGEKADLILGNTSGGLVHLEDISADLPPPDSRDPQIRIFPNPTQGPLSILSSAPGEISLFNMLGQEIHSGIFIQENIPLVMDLYLSPGVYLIHLVSSSGRRTVKKIILKKL